GLSQPAARGTAGRAFLPRRSRRRPDQGPTGAAQRPLHAAVPAAQPAGHARAAPGRRARRRRVGRGHTRRDRRAGAPSAWSAAEGVTSLTAHESVLLAATKTPPPLSDAGNAQLIIAALLGIAVVVLLITWAKFHPFLALMLGTATLGAFAA